MGERESGSPVSVSSFFLLFYFHALHGFGSGKPESLFLTRYKLKPQISIVFVYLSFNWLLGVATGYFGHSQEFSFSL